jgi:hypothetical protein
MSSTDNRTQFQIESREKLAEMIPPGALAKSESRTINSAEPIEFNAGSSIAELSGTRSLRKSGCIY